MKISQVPITNRLDTLLPSPHSNESTRRNTFQTAAPMYGEDEIYLRPIAVIENRFLKKVFNSDNDAIGTIVDVYA